MTTLSKLIRELYKRENNPKYSEDEYEEMFWMMYYGIRPCEWDGRDLYVPYEHLELYNQINNNTCAWETFDEGDR